MTLTLFVGAWLASYRITRVITSDTLTLPLRKRWFKRFPPNADYAKLYDKRVSKLGQLVDCPWCVGFYMSGPVTLFMANSVSMPMPVLWWFAISSAVGLTARNLDG